MPRGVFVRDIAGSEKSRTPEPEHKAGPYVAVVIPPAALTVRVGAPSPRRSALPDASPARPGPAAPRQRPLPVGDGGRRSGGRRRRRRGVEGPFRSQGACGPGSRPRPERVAGCHAEGVARCRAGRSRAVTPTGRIGRCLAGCVNGRRSSVY